MRLKRLLRLEWDAIAGVIAAVVALVLELLHVVEPAVLSAIEGERGGWAEHVVPKVAACDGAEKVRAPRWCSLHESVSFILADTAPEGRVEALLSFWGEPFMSSSTEMQVPRYIFRVRSHSELVTRLSEQERAYRMRARD